MLLGMVIYDLGTLLGLWTVQHSVLAQTFTQGVMPGTGLGIILANSIDYTLAWPAGKHLGLVLTISTTTNFGATGINYIVSSFINPENHSPDLETDHTTYFTHEDVLDRTPYSFVLLSVTFLTIHMLGFFMIRLPSPTIFAQGVDDAESAVAEAEKDEEKHSLAAGQEIRVYDEGPLERTEEVLQMDKEQHQVLPNLAQGGSSHSYVQGKNNCDTAGHLEKSKFILPKLFGLFKRRPDEKTPLTSNRIERVVPETPEEETVLSLPAPSENDTEMTVPSKDRAKNTEKYPLNITASDAIRNKQFYVLFFCIAATEYNYILEASYYKLFAQNVIADDHFLSSIGTMAAISIFICKLLSGVAIDTFGWKNTYLAMLSTGAILSGFWYFTPFINKWFYSFWSCAYASFNFACFSSVTVATCKVFGSEHVTTIFGLISFGGVIATLCLPYTTEALLSCFGWFGAFTAASVFVVVAVILLAVIFPNIK
ncbi:uncharacterized protein LOC101853382 [Aplysia californica]|uniref:Uncharacterized protein LOC101853382 n=1 Tax=Aplysia californica TaxID=6500 RepID=A0ABM0ZYC5_APLCA|nr:uncharacterized protein LOC101853382 [Aplysia californica]